MAKEFKSLKALKKYLETSIEKALKDDPPKAIKNLMYKHILKDVYMTYQRPKIYERRKTSEGLSNKDNIIIENKKGSVVEVYNITKRNSDYNGSYPNMYLAPTIEFGDTEARKKGYKGYDYPIPKYRYFYARPFISNTRESLRNSKNHIKAFKQSLKKYGINSQLSESD